MNASHRKTRRVKRRMNFFDRLLTGEPGKPVDVPVEAVVCDREAVLAHRMRNLTDFDLFDFFLPLLFLVFVFFLQMFRTSGIIVILLRGVLLLDLMKRVRRRPNGRTIVGLTSPYSPWGWGMAFLLYILLYPLSLWLGRQIFFSMPLMALGGVHDMLFSLWLLVAFVSTVVLAPLTEEIWFRGIGMAGFIARGNGPAWATLWTSVIFGILHGPGRMISATVFGFVAALIRFRTGSLKCCIAVHAAHNFMVLAYAAYGYASY